MGNIISLKIRNTVNVLSTIKKNGPVTKNEISKKIGITGVSAHNIVNDLAEQNVIRETHNSGLGTTSGGRKAASYEINPEYGYVIGQRMVRNYIETGIYDFSSQCISYRKVEWENQKPYDILKIMADEMHQIITVSAVPRECIIGAGVSWPGQVNDDMGVIINLPNIPRYQGVEAKAILERQMGFPVYIGNDVKGIVLSLKWLNYCGYDDNLAYFASRQEGIGCGVISDGKVLDGYNHNAGEIAHIKVDYHGKRTQLEEILHFDSLVFRCWRSLGREGRPTAQFSIEEVIRLANEGSQPVLAVLREALDYIVMCIDIMIKLMDPHYFIWQIDWISQIPVLQQELMEAIRSEFSSISYATLRFKMCNMERITTLGAATLLFDNFFTNKSEKNRLFTYNKGILNKRE